jgi:hypothetical protein
MTILLIVFTRITKTCNLNIRLKNSCFLYNGWEPLTLVIDIIIFQYIIKSATMEMTASHDASSEVKPTTTIMSTPTTILPLKKIRK